MEFVIIFLLLGNLIVTFLLWQKNQQQTDQAKKIFEDQADQYLISWITVLSRSDSNAF